MLYENRKGVKGKRVPVTRDDDRRKACISNSPGQSTADVVISLVVRKV
jgi:hypothetical protein